MSWIDVPEVIECSDMRPDERGKRRACGDVAHLESFNPSQQHAFFRCKNPACKSLMVFCYNASHQQRA